MYISDAQIAARYGIIKPTVWRWVRTDATFPRSNSRPDAPGGNSRTLKTGRPPRPRARPDGGKKRRPRRAVGRGRARDNTTGADSVTLMLITQAPPGDPGRAVIRIVARRVPWPTLSQRSERAGLRLRWDALTEDGRLLVEATEFPLADGAHILLSQRGLPGDALVTLRHEGAAYDSFTPQPLHVVAAEGARRAVNRERLARMGRERAGVPQNSPMSDAAGVHPPGAHIGSERPVFTGGV